MNLHTMFRNLHLYTLPVNIVLLWDEGNGSSTLGVPIVFPGLPVDSAFALAGTLPTDPGRSALTLGDGPQLENKDTMTAKLASGESVSIFVHRAQYVQRDDGQTRECGWNDPSQKPERKQLQPEESSPFDSQSTDVKIEDINISDPAPEPILFLFSGSSLDRNSSILNTDLGKAFRCTTLVSKNSLMLWG